MNSTKAQVKLYTRRGCHLCEEAKREMLAAGCADEYTLEEIDIDEDAALRARYAWDIPVVTINGVAVFKHRLEAGEFRAQLRKTQRGR